MNSVLNDCEKIWINAQLATMDPQVEALYGLLRNHSIGVKNGQITIISPMQDINIDECHGEIIDADGSILTPGLIDSHTHLIYGGQRSGEFTQRLNGTSYAEISRAGGGILATVAATRSLTEGGLIQQARPRLEALLNEGVTTVEIKSGYGLTLTDELKMLRAAKKLAADYPFRLRSTLLAAHAIPPEFHNSADAYIELICKEMIPLVAAEGLADAVDIFCEKIAFSSSQSEKIFVAAENAGLGIKVHAEQLSNSHGAEIAASYSAWSVDHLEYLDEAGIKALKKSGTIATLLPGAFYFLGETKKPPVELLRQYQVPMALASDLNPGSCPLASLRLMMNMGCVLFGLTPEEALQATTRNAASALGLGESTGTLSVGKAADMLLWNIDDPAQLAYQFGATPLLQRIFAGELSHV
ncbi:MAG: imidazolonepropionase [Desulfuromusa sp.]|jgi:imidazolonepropionase|nr:imidazolonepropionase [Desulfuromusa sp.]